MKVFQIGHTFQPFSEYLEKKYSIKENNYSFVELQQMILNEGYLAVHLLSPIYGLNPTKSFFTLWNFRPMQIAWAKKRGWNETDLKKILFAQLEDMQPEVFYNLSPILFSSEEIQRVDKKILKLAWFASAERNQIDFSKYDARLTNLPLDFDIVGKREFKSLPFQLSAPYLPDIKSIEKEKFDISFFGQYQPDYFLKRNRFIQQLIKISKKYDLKVSLALMTEKKYQYLFPFRLPLAIHQKFKYQVFPEKIISKNSSAALFGIEIYRQMLNSKVVFNCHGDNAGEYRVNMRIFEALGCGAHMLSDEGIYPDGLKAGEHFSVYKDAAELEEKMIYLLQHEEERRRVASAGSTALRTNYSKEQQWQQFQQIVAQVS